MTKIVIGQIYGSLAEFKAHLRTWAVEDGFAPAILDSDARRVRVGCRAATDCPFRIRCNFDPNTNEARVTTLVDKHTCNPDEDNSEVARGEVTKMQFLLDAVPQLMIIDRSTSTREIIEKVKDRYGQQISLRQAQKVKSTLLSIASEQLGRGLLARMRETLGDDATEEEFRRGKRLRVDDHDAIDPALDDNLNDLDYQDDEQFQHYEDDEAYFYEDDGDGDYFDKFDAQAEQHSRFQGTIGDISHPGSELAESVEPANDNTARSAADIRAEAAALFQQASRKFQEATQLHMQASSLFSQATELEQSQRGG